MKTKLTIIPFIIFLFILLVFFFLLNKERDPSEIPSNLINKNVPSFDADLLLSDQKFISSNEFGKEIIVVNFFATWCKPCRDEHVYIKRFSEEHELKLIGINYKDDKKKTINWLNKLGNPYSKIPIDKNGRIAIDWGVYGIPETFIVNSKGIIKYRHVGPINKKIYKKINLLIRNLK